MSNELPDREGQGGQRRQYFQIEALIERGHRIHVVSPRSPQQGGSIDKIAAVTRFHKRIRRFRIDPLLRRELNRLAEPADRIVMAHIETWSSLRGVLDVSSRPALLDMHNVMSRWYERRGEPHRSDRARVEEVSAAHTFGALSACSAAEAAWLRADLGAEAIVAPNGFAPQNWPAPTTGPVERSVALFGSWGWPPNAGGLSWFLRQVLPRLRADHPGLVVEIAGIDIPPRFAQLPGVRLRGRVSDLPAFLQGAAVVVVPVIVGAGASVKFIDALASGSAVVATGDAAEAAPGSPAFVSNDPIAWVAQIDAALNDSDSAGSQGARCRQYAMDNLTWGHTVAGLDDWIVNAG